MLDDHPEDLALHPQMGYLDEALRSSPVVEAVILHARALALPAWYLGAGGVAQTVWNLRHGFEPDAGIKDYDIVYFDPGDLSEETPRAVEAELTGRLGEWDVVVDVQNEARVHLWYERRYGRAIAPFRSTEAAIATWPTTASSVGVRRDQTGFVVCAPFGLSDLLGMVVRPNRALVSRDVYEEKTLRWARRWPKLRVQPW